MTERGRWMFWVMAAGVILRWGSVGLGAEEEPRGNEEARSIIAHCVVCHRGDMPPAGLDLSRREKAVEGGASGPAIALGRLDDSLILRKVRAGKMPPKKPLEPAEVATLERWLKAGANWEGTIAPAPGEVGPRWVFEPLMRPEIPGKAGNPIDAFVREALRREGLAHSGLAERRTLARRVSFDLTGLPPEPEEVETLVSNGTPEAYSAFVDRLLASPAYGERWARHWLDVARFGESDGFEYDKIRDRAWPYRDYVIRSLNTDKPYSEFIREQIAGDVLPGATEEAVAATGFLVAGPWDEANNIQSSATMRARTREEEIEDMVAAVGQTFLGVTINCARCHDHKFDPIPQRDYYRMASSLAAIKHGNRPSLGKEGIERRESTMASLRAEARSAEREVARFEAEGRARLGGGRSVASTSPLPLMRWSFERDANADLGGINGTLLGGATVSGGSLKLPGSGAFLSAGPLPGDVREKTLEVWVRLTGPDQRGGAPLSLQIKGGGQFDAIVFGERVPGKWMAGSEGFRRSKDLDAPIEGAEPGQTIHMAITYAADGSIRVFRDGAEYAPPYRPDNAPKTYPAGESEILIGLRHTGAGNGFFVGEVEEARVYDRALTGEEIAASFRDGASGIPLAEVLGKLTLEERARREDALRRRDQAMARIRASSPLPLVYAATPAQADVTHVLQRGDVDKRGPEVSAGGLSAIKSPPSDFGLAPDAPEGARRRGLAEWITHPDNPLTYRAMANRLWHYHFGTGLVATPNDLGASGERPSHPELLDWLACELRDGGGRLKALHRLIVTSETYQQSARFDPRAAEKDAEDRLLWRFPPRRLEGEAVRDAMLWASGSLNPEMYGPSFRPFTVKVFGSNIYTLTNPIAPEFNRRTIYRIHVCSAKSPMLEALDCPDPAVKMPRRGVTTTPLQALAMMNDSFVTRQARALAERVRREAGDDHGAMVDRAFRLTLSRPPREDERKRAIDLATSRGMAEVAWALMNATEFVYVY